MLMLIPALASNADRSAGIYLPSNFQSLLHHRHADRIRTLRSRKRHRHIPVRRNRDIRIDLVARASFRQEHNPIAPCALAVRRRAFYVRQRVASVI